MSTHGEQRRLTAPDIRARKGGEPIVALTSYHAHTARLLDKHCDVILVGDSLGMVMHGLETTLPVTLDMMILQGRAVMRGSQHALVVVDMPFGSYEASKEQAFMSAARVLKETGCGAIKVEGGRRMAETIAFLVERGVPVMAHVGLTPQAINSLGGFRAQGRDPADWGPFEEDARAVAAAGAFSVGLEAMAEPLAARLTREIAIPTIGIGASRSTRRWRITPGKSARAPSRQPSTSIRSKKPCSCGTLSIRRDGFAMASPYLYFRRLDGEAPGRGRFSTARPICRARRPGKTCNNR